MGLCSLITAEGDLSTSKAVIRILKLVNMEYSNPPSLAPLVLSCSPFPKLHFPLTWTCFQLREEYYMESDESHCVCVCLLILTACPCCLQELKEQYLGTLWKHLTSEQSHPKTSGKYFFYHVIVPLTIEHRWHLNKQHGASAMNLNFYTWKSKSTFHDCIVVRYLKAR